MPTVHEKHDVQPITLGEHGSGEWSPEYIVRDADSEWEAWQALASFVAAVPTLTIGQETLSRGPIQITERLGIRLWAGRVTWRSRQSRNELLDQAYDQSGQEGFTWQLSTTGGTRHVTQSQGTTRYFLGEGAVTESDSGDRNGAIGEIDDSGKPEGVELPAPVLEWSETHRFPAAFFTFAYIRTLYRLTGTINHAEWRAFEEQEVLFKGITGAQRSIEWVELTFSFAASPNVTDLVIDDITGIAKKGWQYLWTLYEQVEQSEPPAPRIVAKPIAVYVEDVHRLADFSELAIGG